MKNTTLLICLFFCFLQTEAQKVGVVLSGGGATALSHIGFLKVLEENNIPIDYITGTSMGAIVGSMYASGYTLEEIEAMVVSEEFRMMSEGEIGDVNFYFKENEPDASIVTTKHVKGSFKSTSLPTNLINPVQLDYYFMKKLSQPSQAAGYNFDDLYIPFRCVASDIVEKESVLFSEGNLQVAVRASSAYPFYLPPVQVDSVYLYDGGLYNNFPSDIMYNEFLPDIIIGNNVSSNVESPDPDDLFAQLKTMIRHKSNFEPLCDEMFIIEPNINYGTFDFSNIQQVINQGYAATKAEIDNILPYIERRITKEERNAERKVFHDKFKPLVINEIKIQGLDRFQKSYIKKVFNKDKKVATLDQIEESYFKVFSDDKIKSIFPTLSYNTNSEAYTLNLVVEKEKDIFVSFGGNFSSRPINMGFVALRYNFFGRTSSSVYLNSYFGKFYGSVHGNYRLDFSGKFPFSIQPYFTYNRWDYFKSFATFFEEVRPSFIVMNEQFGGIKVKSPLGRKAKIAMEVSYGNIFDDYYQTEEFSPIDTSDRTVFNSMKYSIEYDRSTLNKKFYANKGTKLDLKLSYRDGTERSEPGSTSIIKDTIRASREWIEARFNYTNYFQKLGKLQLGFHLSGVASSRGFFNNYKATLLTTPTFQPIPESNTFFIEQHRANNFATVGFTGILASGKNLEFRGDAHLFKPFGQIVINELNQAEYDNKSAQYFLGSATIIYHSPLGPLSISGNFYDYKENPWSLVFNFGYMLFNDSFRN